MSKRKTADEKRTMAMTNITECYISTTLQSTSDQLSALYQIQYLIG